ncbi:Zinc finger CCCH domain-containing protein [Melia azedarach]|uniref:Zinc finger CCCH domain-containing protein n=1 Tax=Melia azedarach TaxID=155640 RepID=A0ACC1X2M4_MELAZ|nr:Zinc finger CCCH domain-containing protein [Melia azedarach]
MAKQLYGYSSTYGAAGAGGGSGTPTSSATAALSSVYTSRSLADPYHLSDSALRYDPDHSKYSSSSLYDTLRYSGAATSPYLSSQQTWPPGVDPTDHLTAGIKRHSEALYHPTVLGTHTTIGQSEAWYSTNSLAKRPRFESASYFHLYPQRPGEKDCAHYMQTRTCKFGDSCKFDHPLWVPEGGIPDWKEVPLITSEWLPDRPGEPDCPYFLKTKKCKFGLKCKFNHPKDKLIALSDSGNADVSTLPERPSEPPCAFYLKNGICKFGATCKFHHPKDIQISSGGQENGNSKQNELLFKTEEATGLLNSAVPHVPYTPAMLHNSKGLPIRPGEVDCPFYLKTGSCKYGSTCRYNHPDRNAINPPASAIGHPFITSPAASLSLGIVNPAASIYQTIDPRLAQSALGVSPTFYPQRPGQMECDYYMKTGVCKYGERCKFHHPMDWSTAKQVFQETVKLTLAGLPRREGAVHCPYYMKTGSCKYGSTCKFDHPTPGEVMAKAGSQGTSTEGDEKEAETD